jgi:hypothetical protein
MPDKYTREEMDSILGRAIEQTDRAAEGSKRIDHEALVEAAHEVGVPREAVEAAAREVKEKRSPSRSW